MTSAGESLLSARQSGFSCPMDNEFLPTFFDDVRTCVTDLSVFVGILVACALLFTIRFCLVVSVSCPLDKIRLRSFQ